MFDVSDIEIRTLGPDEVIQEPGFYQIPLERHHSQPGDGVSVTSGILRKMELHTPADVWAFHLLNPNRWESKDSPALRMGSAMAAFIEGGQEQVSQHFRVLPGNKPKRPTAGQIEAYDKGMGTEARIRSVKFWHDVDADVRDIITKTEWDLICAMGGALASDPAASAAMEGVPECTMAWKDERTDLWCLARPDTVSFSGLTTDFKKMSTKGTPFNDRMVDRRITDFGYDQLGAFACEGFQQLTGT